MYGSSVPPDHGFGPNLKESIKGLFLKPSKGPRSHTGLPRPDILKEPEQDESVRDRMKREVGWDVLPEKVERLKRKIIETAVDRFKDATIPLSDATGDRPGEVSSVRSEDALADATNDRPCRVSSELREDAAENSDDWDCTSKPNHFEWVDCESDKFVRRCLSLNQIRKKMEVLRNEDVITFIRAICNGLTFLWPDHLTENLCVSNQVREMGTVLEEIRAYIVRDFREQSMVQSLNYANENPLPNNFEALKQSLMNLTLANTSPEGVCDILRIVTDVLKCLPGIHIPNIKHGFMREIQTQIIRCNDLVQNGLKLNIDD